MDVDQLIPTGLTRPACLTRYVWVNINAKFANVNFAFWINEHTILNHVFYLGQGTELQVQSSQLGDIGGDLACVGGGSVWLNHTIFRLKDPLDTWELTFGLGK